MWKASIENGLRVVQKRMLVGQQVRVLMAAVSESSLGLDGLRKSNHFHEMAWQETLSALEGRSQAIFRKQRTGK